MRRTWTLGRSMAVIALGAALVATGCKKKDEQQSSAATTLAAKSKGPDYQVLAPLPRATLTPMALPVVMGQEGPVDVACLMPIATLAPETATVELRRTIEENADQVTKAVRAWIAEDLKAGGIDGVTVAAWNITAEDPFVLDVPRERVRFVADQKCIQPNTGAVEPGQHFATTLIGAKTLRFETNIPLAVPAQDELVRALGALSITVESAALKRWVPAVDDTGKALTTSEGMPLYKSPDGLTVPLKDVPKPEAQMMKEWTIKTEKPIWFAFRELRKDAWRKESAKDKCDVNLIWDDATPRTPECEEFQETSFTAIKAAGGKVAVNIKSGDIIKGVELAFGEVKMVQFDDRVLLWLSPKQIEEGTLIRINSLVLDPGGISKRAKASDDAGYESPKQTKAANEKVQSAAGKDKKAEAKDKKAEAEAKKAEAKAKKAEAKAKKAEAKDKKAEAEDKKTEAEDKKGKKGKKEDAAAPAAEAPKKAPVDDSNPLGGYLGN